MNTNPELQRAWEIATQTNTNIFLTGKAGTGKTTFLRALRDAGMKRIAVVAPTGIAAINAQGVTIHSFFQLPFAPFLPGVKIKGQDIAHMRRRKRQLIRSIDMLVIDEISMVRADLLDAIDSSLRRLRDHTRPFGGVQLLLIGDLQQLAPVVKDEEKALLSQYYETPYFFSSTALQETPFVTIELQHVYRQQDTDFLNLLNEVRTGQVTPASMQALNARYLPEEVTRAQYADGVIRLVTHNHQADNINQQRLSDIKEHEYSYKASVEDVFPESAFPTEEVLHLKKGAQVMFVKNDTEIPRRYYNGMMGRIVEIDATGFTVLAHSHDDEEEKKIKVEPAEWTNINYVLNERTRELSEEVIGTFKQFPVKLAWAITVHKSQGLTFDHAIIDVQNSFAHGQTYVALSRCRTLEGILLANPVNSTSIIHDHQVLRFSDAEERQMPTAEEIERLERQCLVDTLSELFGFSVIHREIRTVVSVLTSTTISKKYPTLVEAWKAEESIFDEDVMKVAARFKVHYNYMAMTPEKCAYTPSASLSQGPESHASLTLKNEFQDRIIRGASYFYKNIKQLAALVKQSKFPEAPLEATDRLETAFQNMSEELAIKKELLDWARTRQFQIINYQRYRTDAIAKVLGKSDKKK